MLDKIDLKRSLICISILLLGVIIGGHIAGHVMFGILMFAGLVALVENMPTLKKLVIYSNKALDIGIFIASVLATIYMGVTITGAITVASLIFSLIYAPMLRKQALIMKEEKKFIDKRIKKTSDTRYKRITHRRIK